MFSATARMRSGSATEVPPYFWTTRLTTARLRTSSHRGLRAERGLACLAVPTEKRQRQREKAAPAKKPSPPRRSARRRRRLVTVGAAAVVGIGLLFGPASSAVRTTDQRHNADGTTTTALAPGTPTRARRRMGRRPVRHLRQAPTMCIDQAKTYTADRQDRHRHLQGRARHQEAPNTVNNFVFLARNQLLRRRHSSTV